MELKAIKTIAAAALLATATTASAGTAPFTITSDAPGVDVGLIVQESNTPGYDYDFVVSNSSLMGVVTGVYFESALKSVLGEAKSTGDATLLESSQTAPIDGWDGTGVAYTVENTTVTTTSRQRVGRFLRDVTVVTDTGDADLGQGLQSGESQTFSFSSDNISLEDLHALIGTEGYGVAIRVQGLDSEDEQAAAWGIVEAYEIPEQADVLVGDNDGGGFGGNGGGDVEVTATPSPTAAIAGLAVFGIAGLRRRRK